MQKISLVTVLLFGIASAETEQTSKIQEMLDSMEQFHEKKLEQWMYNDVIEVRQNYDKPVKTLAQNATNETCTTSYDDKGYLVTTCNGSYALGTYLDTWGSISTLGSDNQFLFYIENGWSKSSTGYGDNYTFYQQKNKTGEYPNIMQHNRTDNTGYSSQYYNTSLQGQNDVVYRVHYGDGTVHIQQSHEIMGSRSEVVEKYEYPSGEWSQNQSTSIWGSSTEWTYQWHGANGSYDYQNRRSTVMGSWTFNEQSLDAASGNWFQSTSWDDGQGGYFIQYYSNSDNYYRHCDSSGNCTDVAQKVEESLDILV